MKRLVIFFVLFLFLNCSMTISSHKTRESIYANLMVALGEEINNEMQCVAEFMKDPDDFKKIALNEGAKVKLDNVELPLEETYYPSYAIERKATEFLGKHKWTIDIGNGKLHEFEFEVFPFEFTSIIPKKIGKSDLKVNCENLKSSDKVFLMLTGSFSEDSETSLEIKPEEGFFIIPKEFLNKVDPIKLEMHFNISRTRSINDDDYFGKGVDIEWTKVTKNTTRLLRDKENTNTAHNGVLVLCRPMEEN